MPTDDELDAARRRAWALRNQLIEATADRDRTKKDYDSARRERLLPKVLLQLEIAAEEAQAVLADVLGGLADLSDRFPQVFKQPAYILQLDFDNPDPQVGFDPAQITWGGPAPTPFVGGAFLSVDAKLEWKQVAEPHDADYEDANLVGASGWALDCDVSLADVPFDHPFGFDYEFMLALDQPADDPERFMFLLSRANDQAEEKEEVAAIEQAVAMTIPLPLPLPDGKPGLLAVEVNKGLLPAQFTDAGKGGMLNGDRVAAVGRWIVNCGHEVALGDQSPSYRTEIHPPLLLASAHVTNVGLVETALDRPRTRVSLVSRPYLVSHQFCVDPGNAYDDQTDNDGPLWDHLLHELVGLASGDSLQVEAHPKIKALPFRGRSQARFVVRPPIPDNPFVSPGQLYAAYQFTVRSGCTVNVTDGEPGSFVVTVTLDSAAYVSPGLPPRHERTYSRGQLDKLSPGSGGSILKAEVLGAALSLSPVAVVALLELNDFLTDEYEPVSGAVGLFDRQRPQEVLAGTLPRIGGVAVDDTQPFPVYGWIEVGYRPLTTFP